MKLKMSVILLLLLYLISPSVVKPQEQKRDMVVIKAMEEELKRSWEKLRLDGYECPFFFISYQIKDNTYYSIKGKYGAIVSSDNNRARRLFVDVRVGNYDFDNSIRGKSGGGVPFYDASYAPIDNNIDAIRTVLWQVTDYTYKQAITQYFNKKASNVQKVKDENFPSFSQEEAYTYYDPDVSLVFDPKEWEDKIREVSAVYKDYKELMDADVNSMARKETT